MSIQFTREQAIKAVNAVRQLHDRTADFLNAQGLTPAPESIAANELRTFERPESVVTAYSQGTSLIEVATDHLIAFTKAVTEPATAVAPWTIARAVLEPSALSCWLLDTKITIRERIGRSLALRYEGFAQQIKFGQALDHPIETAEVIARMEQVAAMAESIGFAPLRNIKGKRTGIGQVMPSITEIIRDTLDEEAHYRLFSAMAHAHHWAFSQLSFQIAGAMEFHNNRTFLLEKNLSAQTVLWLCARVARYFAQPVKLHCKLFGWSESQLGAILDYAFTEIGVRPGSELWHS